MNKIKKCLLFCLSSVLSLTFLISSFPLGNKNFSKYTNNQTLAASSESSTTNKVQLIDNTVLNNVKISIDGKALNTENIKSVDKDGDGKVDTSYIIIKNTVTLSFEPLKYSYSAIFDEDKFYKKTIESNVLTRDAATNAFPTSFRIDETEYNYQISDKDGSISISKGSSSIVQGADFLEMAEVDGTRQFIFTTEFTLKEDAGDTSFVFSTSNTNASTSTTSYSLNFLRPIQDFDTDAFVYFTFSGIDVGDSTYHKPLNKDESSYETMKIEFQNNDYTEDNPLYININHNGFIYTFNLYSKRIESVDYLFVEYYDEQRKNNETTLNNNKSLATKINTNSGSIDVPVFKYTDDETMDFNKFSIDFDKTGRYEIEIYDSTYLLLKNQRQITETVITKEDGTKETVTNVIEPEDNSYNYNYYSTSFYIKTKEDASENSSSAYDNAYAIMQSYDDDGTLMDYIVSESTQNTNVKITVKNLSYYFDKDETISSIESEEELASLNVLKFTKTTLAGSTNIPEETYYSVSDILKIFDEDTNKDKNFTINCTDDAFYEIFIYRYHRSSSGTLVKISERKYQFTIVKQPKISFTVIEVNSDNDPIKDDSTGQYKTKLHEADTPYKTTPETYKININSNMNLSIFFSKDSTDISSIELKKTYLNEYTINYAMQAVLAEKIAIYKEGSNNQTELDVLGLRFYGVGDITVKVTYNSKTSTYNLASGSTLTFDDYGTYSVSIQDSMGTIGTYTFNYKKPVSVSAVIMIILVGVIALVVVLFVISSRGKVATR